MRKTVLAMLMLVALLTCCLIAGTPVNNDVSREATTAGIHLTPPPASAKAVATTVAPLLARLAVFALLVAGLLLASLPARPARAAAGMQSLRRARAGDRRGPPAALAI